VAFVMRLFEPPPVTDDRPLAAEGTHPRQSRERDLGHPRCGLVFRFWQCDKENQRLA
jgi:hypothetical protein